MIHPMQETPADEPLSADGKLPDTDAPPDAINLNVSGKKLVGPDNGFGQLWRKRYRIRLLGAQTTPQAVIRRWKARFPDYWPDSGQFFGSRPRIEQGEVAVVNLEGPGGSPIATGVAVVHADDESFVFMTPQGHVFAGVINFKATLEENVVVAEVELLIRAGDPLFEVGARLGIVHNQEDKFWGKTLTNLAADFGVRGQPVEITAELLDRRVRWTAAGNVWHNSAIRTALYLPIHGLRRLFGK